MRYVKIFYHKSAKRKLELQFHDDNKQCVGAMLVEMSDPFAMFVHITSWVRWYCSERVRALNTRFIEIFASLRLDRCDYLRIR